MDSIGKLDKLVEIGHMVKKTSPSGAKEEIFVRDFKPYASVKSLSGRVFYEAKAVNMEDTIEFTIRYRPNITTKNKIKFQDVLYDIIHINNIDFSNKWLRIKANVVNK